MQKKEPIIQNFPKSMVRFDHDWDTLLKAVCPYTFEKITDDTASTYEHKKKEAMMGLALVQMPGQTIQDHLDFGRNNHLQIMDLRMLVSYLKVNPGIRDLYRILATEGGCDTCIMVSSVYCHTWNGPDGKKFDDRRVELMVRFDGKDVYADIALSEWQNQSMLLSFANSLLNPQEEPCPYYMAFSVW